MTFASVMVLLVVVTIIALLVAKAFNVKVFSWLGGLFKKLFSSIKKKTKKEKVEKREKEAKSIFSEKKADITESKTKILSNVGKEKVKADIKQDVVLGKVVGETAKQKQSARDPNKVSKVTKADFDKNNIVLPKESVLMRENDESVNGVKDANTDNLMSSHSSKMATGLSNIKSASDFKIPSFDTKFKDEDIDFNDDPFNDVDLDALLEQLEKEEKMSSGGKGNNLKEEIDSSFAGLKDFDIGEEAFKEPFLSEDKKAIEEPKEEYFQKDSDEYFTPQTSSRFSGLDFSGVGSTKNTSIESRFEQVFGQNNELSKNRVAKEILVNEVLGEPRCKTIRAKREERRKRLNFM